MSFSVLFLLVALVLAAIAAFGVPSGRFSLLAGSLAFYFLSLLVGSGIVSG